MTTTGTSKIFNFSEEEIEKACDKIEYALNSNDIENKEINLLTLIFLATTELRRKGYPMISIVEFITNVEAFKEKLN